MKRNRRQVLQEKESFCNFDVRATARVQPSTCRSSESSATLCTMLAGILYPGRKYAADIHAHAPTAPLY
jgi:hypothetical protein